MKKIRLLILLFFILFISNCSNAINSNWYSDIKLIVISKELNKNSNIKNGKFKYRISHSYYSNITQTQNMITNGDEFILYTDKDFELNDKLIITTEKVEERQ